MTKQQIEMLRGLIQQEIEHGLEVYNGNIWTFERSLDKYWDDFAETFNSTPTEPLEIDV